MSHRKESYHKVKVKYPQMTNIINIVTETVKKKFCKKKIKPTNNFNEI